jgi:Domain of unknown function (DUF5664)
MRTGVKHDARKPRFSLLPTRAVADVVAVLEYGARKYAPGNWMIVPDARTRYFDAAQRHLLSWWDGERIDPESGLPHLAHATCCLLFLAWFDSRSMERDSVGYDANGSPTP